MSQLEKQMNDLKASHDKLLEKYSKINKWRDKPEQTDIEES